MNQNNTFAQILRKRKSSPIFQRIARFEFNIPFENINKIDIMLRFYSNPNSIVFHDLFNNIFFLLFSEKIN